MNWFQQKNCIHTWCKGPPIPVPDYKDYSILLWFLKILAESLKTENIPEYPLFFLKRSQAHQTQAQQVQERGHITCEFFISFFSGFLIVHFQQYLVYPKANPRSFTRKQPLSANINHIYGPFRPKVQWEPPNEATHRHKAWEVWTDKILIMKLES